MNAIKLKLISLADIIKANCLNIKIVIETIEKAFLDFQNNKIMLPDKISQVFNEESQNRINCMPSTLFQEQISGVKWVSVFPENPKKYNTPNVSGIIVLSELKQGYPYAIVEGSLITAMRTACVGALGAKYLARKDSKVYCSIGSGEQAKMHFMSIKEVRPSISICKVASRTQQGEDRFVEDLQKKYPEVEFIKCHSDYEKASIDSDIIVTAVSCQAPLLKAKTIKEGAFYCHVGGWEDEYEVPLMANKIVCDRWESVKHRSQTISRLFNSADLKDSDIYADIAEIISGLKPGRENDKEFIYFNSVGLAFIDIAVAKMVYDKVSALGYGIDWIMQDKDITSCLF